MTISYVKANHYPTKSNSGLAEPIVGLVMHTTEGYGRSYLNGLFQGDYKREDGVGVSVHWGIYRDGSIVEYAPWRPGEAYWCWHAGKSYMDGYGYSLSRKTLGYEIEHVSGDAYSPAVVEAVLYLNAMVQEEYRKAGIELKLWTHEEIAWPRGRKPDPTKPWKTDVAPLVYAAWNNVEEDDMYSDADRDRDNYTAVRVLATSFDVKILEAKQAGDAAEVDYLERLKKRDVRNERIRRGILKGEIDEMPVERNPQ